MHWQSERAKWISGKSSTPFHPLQCICRKLKFYTSRTALGAFIYCWTLQEKKVLCNGQSYYIKSGEKKILQIYFIFATAASDPLFMVTFELISQILDALFSRPFSSASSLKYLFCEFPFFASIFALASAVRLRTRNVVRLRSEPEPSRDECHSFFELKLIANNSLKISCATRIHAPHFLCLQARL